MAFGVTGWSISGTYTCLFSSEEQSLLQGTRADRGLILVVNQFHKFLMIWRWNSNDRKETAFEAYAKVSKAF